MSRARKIRTKPDAGKVSDGELSGWLAGRQTYLWFGQAGDCTGMLSGHKLYRLAKAIVRQFEDSAR